MKDNYPLPKIEQILQKVVGAQRISMVDGFSGYHQIAMHPDDKEKTTFTTPSYYEAQAFALHGPRPPLPSYMITCTLPYSDNEIGYCNVPF